MTAFETSSSHFSASEGVRLCPLCICICICICIATETGGGEWSAGSGCTQEDVPGGIRVKI